MTDFCPTCGASWACDCPHQTRTVNGLMQGDTLAEMRSLMNPDGTDPLWDKRREFERMQAVRADALPPERFHRDHQPTIWPRPGWKEQAQEKTLSEALEELSRAVQPILNAWVEAGRQMIEQFAHAFAPILEPLDDLAVKLAALTEDVSYPAVRRDAFAWLHARRRETPYRSPVAALVLPERATARAPPA